MTIEDLTAEVRRERDRAEALLAYGVELYRFVVTELDTSDPGHPVDYITSALAAEGGRLVADEVADVLEELELGRPIETVGIAGDVL